MDLLDLPIDPMSSFRFHGWLVVEVFSDQGHTGIGNAALAPRVTKQVIDLYLKPILVGSNPFDYEFLWQHMYRKTMAFGRKGIGMVAISAVDIALWDLVGKITHQPVFRLLGGKTKQRIPVYASRLYSQRLDELAKEARRYKDEGYRAMKLRFGWGPVDGAAGIEKNLALVGTAREVVGNEIDLMADAYMGWTLDYARRMILLLEPYHLRWLEEPVIPDNIAGYAELKRMNGVRIPRAARGARSRRHPIRHQPRRRHHAGAESFRARRSARSPRHPARRADAQLSYRRGEPEFAHGGILSQGGRGGRQRALLVHLQGRARAAKRLYRAR